MHKVDLVIQKFLSYIASNAHANCALFHWCISQFFCMSHVGPIASCPTILYVVWIGVHGPLDCSLYVVDNAHVVSSESFIIQWVTSCLVTGHGEVYIHVAPM
jgi:hypothetical protein